MEEIICPQCGHSIEEHDDDYDGGGECKECIRINLDYDPSFSICWYRPETIEIAHFKKQVEIKELANKELQHRIIALVNDIKTIVNADVNLSATDLRLYAFDCLLKKGYISNNKEPV
jgi:predicted amidophosphoribosyltransferase